MNDMPSWVGKSLKRIKHEQERLILEENERDEKEKIVSLKEKLDEFESRNRSMLTSMKDKLKKLKLDMAKKDKQLSELGVKIVAKEEEAEKLKGVQVLKEIKKEEQQQKKPD